MVREMKPAGKIWRFVKSFVLFACEKAFSPAGRGRPLDIASIKKILIMPPGGIGDLVLVFPALAALEENFPGASISMLTARSARKAISLSWQSGSIEEIMDYVYSNPNARIRTFFEKFFLILWLRAKRFDLIYSTARGGGLRDEPLMSFLIGAPHRLGFKAPGARSLNTVAVEFNEEDSILVQNLAILKAAGLELPTERVEIAVAEEDKSSARELLSKAGLEDTSSLVAIHPGASFMANFKSWPVENYIVLIESLLEGSGAGVVLVGSPGETAISEEIIGRVSAPGVVSLVGKTTVPEMAAVIELSSLFIGNDSGPLHLATALRRPAIGLFGPTSPAQILSSANSCIVFRKDMACSPCYTHMDHFSPPCGAPGHPECMRDIPVCDVEGAAKRLLSVCLMEASKDAKLTHI